MSVAFLPGVAWSADFLSPRSAALGGSGHAGPLLNDTIFLNPAFTSFVPANNVSVNYLMYSGDGNQAGRNYNVSIQDGRNPMLQAGAAYTVREDGAFLHMGISKAVIARLGFGLGGKLLFDSRTHKNSYDAVFATAAIPFDWLQTAFIIDNLFETKAGVSRGMRREFILGTKFNVKGIVLVYFDPHFTPLLADGQRYGFESGLEFTIMSDLFLRMGAFKNSMIPQIATRGRGYGAGFGWVAPRVSFDYGIQRALDPVAVTTHSLGMTLYF